MELEKIFDLTVEEAIQITKDFLSVNPGPLWVEEVSYLEEGVSHAK